MLKVIKGQASPGDRLVTKHPIPAGTAFLKLDRLRTVSEPTYQTVQVGVSRHVLARGTLVSLNHHCDPNVVIDATSRACVATRDIAAGEELGYFYPSTEWVMARPFLCLCGAPNCIRIVTGARHLSTDVLSRFFINAHIRVLMSRDLEQSHRLEVRRLQQLGRTQRPR